MKVAFKTLGCKLNQYEEYAIKENLEKHKKIKEKQIANKAILSLC